MNGTININGSDYAFKEGETILTVALRNNINIPVLCYLKDIAETGACRICLVEVEGVPQPVASCSAFASDGMVIRTDSEEIRKHRLQALSFILLKHPLKCGTCENYEDCLLRDLARQMGVSEAADTPAAKQTPLKDWNALLYDRDACVLCMRCVNICSDVTGCAALEVTARGHKAHVSPKNEPLDCDFCGICVDVCPVGAIKDKSFKYSLKVWELDYINASCAFCSAGCQINYGVHDNIIHRTRHSGEGYTCSKGRYGFKFLESGKRVKEPLIKKHGAFVKTGWREAMEAVYNAITKYGAENCLIAAGAWLSNEELLNFKSLADKTGMMFITEAELYFGKFMRLFKDKFGGYKSVGTLKDIEKSDMIFVVGADFSRENIGVKWNVMKGIIQNDAKAVTIGLHPYDYGERVFLNITADYADFAGVFEKIKNSDETVYVNLRKHIETSKKISVIAGNEYFQGETDPQSILAFADFIGEEKLAAFIPVTDKLNYGGQLHIGGNTLEEVTEKAPKTVIAAAINPGAKKHEELFKIIKNAKFYAATDLFARGMPEKANVILPARANLEINGTTISLDGKLLRLKKIINAPAGVKSNSEIAGIIGELFRKKIDSGEETAFKNNAAVFSLKASDWESETPVYCIRQEKSFKATPYSYGKTDKPEKTVYINPRRTEKTLIKILESEESPQGLTETEKQGAHYGASRNAINKNTAKGVRLITRS